jgi:hypothetical protein
MDLPLHSKRQFVAAGYRLNSDILLSHSASQQALLGSSYELINDSRVPSGMNDSHTQARSYSRLELARVIFPSEASVATCGEACVFVPSWLWAAPGPLMGDIVEDRDIFN